MCLVGCPVAGVMVGSMISAVFQGCSGPCVIRELAPAEAWNEAHRRATPVAFAGFVLMEQLNIHRVVAAIGQALSRLLPEGVTLSADAGGQSARCFKTAKST